MKTQRRRLGKLGGLVLSGLKRGHARRPRKSVRRRNPLFFSPPRALPNVFANRSRRPSSGAKAHPDSEVSASATPPAPTPAFVISQSSLRQNPPAPRAESFERRTLTPRDLIRPDDRLRQSIEAFLLDQRSVHTRRSYGQDLRRFMKFLLVREEAIARVDRAAIVAYKEFLISEDLEHTTIDRHLATLRSFFQWLVDDDILAKSPAESVRFLNPKRISRTIGFSDEEVRRMLGAPNLHSRIGSLHHAVLAILFYCGLRRSEICDLRRSNLTSERGQAILRLKGKGDVERIVALPAPAIGALDHYLLITLKSSPPQGIDPYLFTPIRNNRTGVADKPLDPSMIYYIVRRYARSAGVESRVSPHSCRATAISNARDHQVPDRAIQEFAGWSTPAMITRYDKRRTAAASSASLAISYAASDLPPAHLLKPQK